MEKIAIGCWKLRSAIQHETGAIREGYAFLFHPESRPSLNPTEEFFRSDDDFDKILRYGNTTNRQLSQDINQLQSLQRSRSARTVPVLMNDSTEKGPFCQTNPPTTLESAEAPESSASSKAEGASQSTPAAQEESRYANWESRLKETAKLQ